MLLAMLVEEHKIVLHLQQELEVLRAKLAAMESPAGESPVASLPEPEEER
jgi:uncharacterized coiled-coil protein SlyX